MPTIDRGDATLWWEEEGPSGPLSGEQGAGDPVLLIMGLGYSADMWFRLVPELSSRFRTLRFDNRGVGRTGVPAGPYPIETMAADAVAVLDAAGVDRAHVVGASMGGFIAQEVVLRHPDRVRSLVLGCTGPGGEAMVPAEPAAMEMAASRASMTPEEAAEVAIPFVYASSTPRERIDEDFAVRAALPTSPEGYTNQLQGVVAWGGSHDRLGSIAVPTLVIQGTADRLVNPGNAEVLVDAIPDAELVLLEGASHVFFTDQPEASAKAIVSFLERQP